MLFTADAHTGLASGEISVTYRAWRRPRVKVGGRYRIGGRHVKTDIYLLVDSIETVAVAGLTESDARRAGHSSREALLANLRKDTTDLGEQTTVFAIEFHRVPAPETTPLSDHLDTGAIEAIQTRLHRLERNREPWTIATLQLISQRPGVVSTELAALLGRERFSFKDDVSKLKRLGLTESLPIGYRLSPRGHTLMAAIASRTQGSGRE